MVASSPLGELHLVDGHLPLSLYPVGGLTHDEGGDEWPDPRVEASLVPGLDGCVQGRGAASALGPLLVGTLSVWRDGEVDPLRAPGPDEVLLVGGNGNGLDALLEPSTGE